MKAGSILVGVIVLAVAIWMLVSLENPTARWLGGIVVAIVGIFIIMKGMKKEEAPVVQVIKPKKK